MNLNCAYNLKGEEIKPKINIYEVPGFAEVLDRFKNSDLRDLAAIGLSIAPLQFWIMPASMSKNKHHVSEHEIGQVSFDEVRGLYRVEKVGGKAYHTLRVCKVAEIFMEADDPLVTDWQGNIKSYKAGNELTSREQDIVRLCCLWHDIFSGGTGDEFDFSRKKLDTYHPHYHRTEFAHLSKMVSEEEWELILYIISQHMWKWDDKIEPMKFHDMKKCRTVEEAYEMMKKYRLVRIVELSDLIASRNF